MGEEEEEGRRKGKRRGKGEEQKRKEGSETEGRRQEGRGKDGRGRGNLKVLVNVWFVPHYLILLPWPRRAIPGPCQ